MVADPRLYVEGPYDTNGNSVGRTTPLYLAEKSTGTTKTDTERRDIPTQDDESSILNPISGKRSFRFNGTVSGERLVLAGYGSTKKEAIRNYLPELETLVLEEQGLGFRLELQERGEEFVPTTEDNANGVLFDNVRWEFQSGDAYTLEWNLDGKITEGVQNAKSRDGAGKVQRELDQIQFEETKILVQDVVIPLGEVEKRSYERDIDLNLSDLIHQTDAPNVASIETGVKGDVRFEGRIADQQVSKSLDQIAREINRSVNDGGIHGSEGTINDGLSGRSFTGAVTDTEATFVAGEPDKLEYRIELEIGQTPATLNS